MSSLLSYLINLFIHQSTMFCIVYALQEGPSIAGLSPHISASIKPASAKLLADCIISVSCSPWCCPLHCVPKKDDSWRPTGDYRPLNNLTLPDTYLPPHLQSFTDQINGKTVFSKIVLRGSSCDKYKFFIIHFRDK